MDASVAAMVFPELTLVRTYTWAVHNDVLLMKEGMYESHLQGNLLMGVGGGLGIYETKYIS